MSRPGRKTLGGGGANRYDTIATLCRNFLAAKDELAVERPATGAQKPRRILCMQQAARGHIDDEQSLRTNGKPRAIRGEQDVGRGSRKLYCANKPLFDNIEKV